jgi:4'-phosphopantetheinyl transferase
VSLTDRAGCAVCLVAARLAAVGCDVEIIEPRSDAFVRDYLTQAEQRLVGAAGPARHMAANLVWSAKESALKVLRTGLRRDTRSVEVEVDELSPPERTWSALRVRTAEGEVFPGWWRRSGPFLVTACWPGGGPPPGALDAQSPIDTLLPLHGWMRRPIS